MYHSRCWERRKAVPHNASYQSARVTVLSAGQEVSLLDDSFSDLLFISGAKRRSPQARCLCSTCRFMEKGVHTSPSYCSLQCRPANINLHLSFPCIQADDLALSLTAFPHAPHAPHTPLPQHPQYPSSSSLFCHNFVTHRKCAKLLIFLSMYKAAYGIIKARGEKTSKPGRGATFPGILAALS